MNMNPGQQPQDEGEINSLNLSYEQFQDQVRQRREQEQAQGRIALQRAGADNSAEKVRALVNTMQELVQELSMTENQIQVQADAQLRQIRKLKDRATAIEAEVRGSISPPTVH
ncbi:hypothetical protein [Paenibacillus herberti]|uniref:Uncharacterized protein n=1 Tax=Paenibacillus herberti TaxID=1619309 RepID=A0A229P1J2_9BACL|nr:hypothetical protein [Paenibacillus herberti]OXM16146.1 hypothetical protein CGZ75_05440 [Paenibacillus herberti]